MNLTFNTMTASVQESYPHDPPLFPNSQGDVEAQSSGDELIGLGAESYYSEYTAERQHSLRRANARR